MPFLLCPVFRCSHLTPPHSSLSLQLSYTSTQSASQTAFGRVLCLYNIQPHLTAIWLPEGALEVLPSCSGTGRWCCWSATPSHGGWRPVHALCTRSHAGPTAAGEGFGPSGWWVAPRQLEWGFPLNQGVEGSPVKRANQVHAQMRRQQFFNSC